MAITETAVVNPIKTALESGKFCYFTELVPSAKMTEERVMELASGLAGVKQLTAAGITSYAGGSQGHDPIRISVEVRKTGLAPNVHLTCVNRSPENMAQAVQQLVDQGLHNVFAITGDYPSDADPNHPPLFAYDAVQLVEGLDEVRRHHGVPFYISVAVSPFKYTEADCAYQYLKLEKKIAAGADFAITQLGYDSRKFRELKRYLDERGLKTPLLGNVYLVGAKPAERMAKGSPPGCWVAPEMLARLQEEAKAEDKGLGARLERAAKMVAMLRGIGYAGAYIGGDHNPKHLEWVIQRSEEIADRWEEFAEEISYAPKGGFYFYDSVPETPSKQFMPAMFDTLGSLFPVKKDTALRRALQGVFRWVDTKPAVAHAIERFEFSMKQPMFGCQACGSCVLGEMEYVCPMTCPKNLRNGPCGGTSMGQCEVYPDKPCIWVSVYDRAKAAGHTQALKTFIPARDLSLKGTGSWINLFLDRDSRPGKPQPPLIQISESQKPQKRP